ncbi:methyltransferase domain-containing protein [Intrasporangium sp.]|uniref:methyltransferase domain-containing protein n=1 Tax=Intrasporangium sp. TaxID=1925024 RepID=UPI00293B166D|nr:methyltransferase domain-containing protein [Intrasporangium sp.]MDV3221784.1 methyltransferase domain-containing protein [Intrasporangium sp.]
MTPVDASRAEAFISAVQAGLAATATTVMTHLGDRLGLYRALAQGPATPGELGSRTGCAERYLREWLAQQTAAGVLDHDPTTGRFSLPAEHAPALGCGPTDASFMGGFAVLTALAGETDRLADEFRSARGIPWGEHGPTLHQGVAEFFGAAYERSLISEWIPALGVENALAHGARVVDVGCGQGVTTVLLADAFPRSTFVGIDSHEASLAAARQRAVEAGVAERVSFELTNTSALPDGPFDLIWFFDVLHDLGDPVTAAAASRERLAEGGIVAVVEPFAVDPPEANIRENPAALLHYTASTFMCVPHSMSEPGQATLGAQGGPAGITDVLHEAGFANVQQVTSTPLHAVYAARV